MKSIDIMKVMDGIFSICHNNKVSPYENATDEIYQLIYDIDDSEDISDGYHTFRDLYEQRMILSSTICILKPEICWKSKLHHDGNIPFCDEDEEIPEDKRYFIIGFDTPEGSYTYHYKLKYWDMFPCEELERGKEWDGHTSKDIARLLSIVK